MSEIQLDEFESIVELHDHLDYCRTLEGHGAGGCLHIVTDDDNIEDDHVAWCLRYAHGKGCWPCVVGAFNLLLLGEEDRLRAIGYSYEEAERVLEEKKRGDELPLLRMPEGWRWQADEFMPKVFQGTARRDEPGGVYYTLKIAERDPRVWRGMTHGLVVLHEASQRRFEVVPGPNPQPSVVSLRMLAPIPHVVTRGRRVWWKPWRFHPGPTVNLTPEWVGGLGEPDGWVVLGSSLVEVPRAGLA